MDLDASKAKASFNLAWAIGMIAVFGGGAAAVRPLLLGFIPGGLLLIYSAKLRWQDRTDIERARARAFNWTNPQYGAPLLAVIGLGWCVCGILFGIR